MGTLQKDSRATADAASRKFAYWEIPYRQNDWWGFQCYSEVSSFAMRTLLHVRLAWWDWFPLWKEEQREWEDNDEGLASGQQGWATSPQPHCHAASLLSPVPGGTRLTTSWPGPSRLTRLCCINDLSVNFLSWLTATWKKNERSYAVAPLPKGSLTQGRQEAPAKCMGGL